MISRLTVDCFNSKNCWNYLITILKSVEGLYVNGDKLTDHPVDLRVNFNCLFMSYDYYTGADKLVLYKWNIL